MSITKLAYQSTTSQWPLVGNSKTQINASPLNCCPSKHVSLKEGWSSSLSVGVEERFVAVVQLLRPLPTLGHHNSCLGLRVDGERQTRPEGHQLGDLLLIDPVQRKTEQQEKKLDQHSEKFRSWRQRSEKIPLVQATMFLSSKAWRRSRKCLRTDPYINIWCTSTEVNLAHR